MRFTVEKNRGSVEVLNWGSPPFAQVSTRKGRTAFVPNGFLVITLSNAVLWVGETRVVDDTRAEYRFVPKDLYSDYVSDCDKEWRGTPTEAYHYAQFVFYNQVEPKRGVNGQLLIGVCYERLQREIARVHAVELAEWQHSFNRVLSYSPQSPTCWSETDSCLNTNKRFCLSPPDSVVDDEKQLSCSELSWSERNWPEQNWSERSLVESQEDAELIRAIEDAFF